MKKREEMKKRTPLVVFLLTFLIFNFSIEFTNSERVSVSHRAVLGFWDSTTVGSIVFNATIASYGARILTMDKVLNFAVVEVEGDADLFIHTMSNQPFIRYAEMDQIMYTTLFPNDPRYSDQWGPTKINAPGAWDLEVGDSSVKLAIVDTGVDYDHEDLQDRFGFLNGIDIVNGDDDPMPDPGVSGDEHGTHCAGIAAATINNNKGIAGMAQVTLLAVKVFNGRTGYASDVAQGIRWAADNGANVISLSLGGGSVSYLEDACEYAWNQGLILVASSGNDDHLGVDYPAAYETVIAVGAIDQNDQRCSYPGWWGSNYGQELELVAPGHEILSTVLSNSYSEKDGTSMATPHVSGVAALILSSNLGLTNQQVRDILDTAADDLGEAGRDIYFGFGRVDAYEAVLNAVIVPHAVCMPSVGSRWWETYSTNYVTTTSSSFSNMPGMSYSCYLPHAGHLEVRLTLEYRVTSSDNCEVRCSAVKGTTTYYARPGVYWLGRGDYYGKMQTRMLTFTFENLPAGTYTVSIEWRSMTSGHTTAADERIMTITWVMHP